MKGRKPFRTRLKRAFAVAAALIGGSLAGGSIEMMPKDQATDTQVITAGFGEHGINISAVDQMWKASISMMSQNELEAAAVEAARKGDSWRTRALLEKGLSVYSPFAHEAFAIAAGQGDMDVVNAYMSAGIDPGANDGAALVSAIRGNQYGFALKLIYEHKVNANAGNGDALIFAAMKNNQDLVDALLANGADAKAQDSAALRFGAMMGASPTMISALIQQGADVKASNGEALVYAAAGGNLEALKLMVAAGGDISVQNGAVLIQAAESGRTDVVKYVLGLKKTLGDDYGFTFEVPYVDVNISNGAALMSAVGNFQYDTVRALAEAGANLNISNGAALSTAAYNGDAEMVSILVARGADVNAGNGGALYISVITNNPTVAQMLMSFGANPDLRNGEIKQAAEKSTHPDMKEIIKGKLFLEHFPNSMYGP